MSCLALLLNTTAGKAGRFHVNEALGLHVKCVFFWGHWLLCLNAIILHFARTYTYMMGYALRLPRSHCREWCSQVEGILESRGYWLWLRTVCALHSKWPPLPYHLWIINVQSVGLSFVIGHSDTVQFSSQPHASLWELGSSLKPPSPPSLHPPSPPPSLCSALWITQEPWSTSVCYYLARGKMLSWRNCLVSSHYSNISQTQGPWKALEISICVAFKSQYIPAVSCVAFKV